MRLALFADTHIDARDQHATLDEQVRWLQAMGRQAADAGAQVILHGGDVYDAESSPEEREAADAVLSAWTERAAVVIVRGNHDSRRDVQLLGRLRTRRPIYVLEEPGMVRFDGLDVACLPWPRRAVLAAAMGVTSKDELGQAAAARLRQIVSGFAADWRPGAARVVLAHAELGGASLDSGQPLVAHCDVALSEADLLATGADFVGVGHIHRSQTIAGRIRYPGSPRATAFGQDDDPKGYSLVEVARGAEPRIEHRVGPARRLVTVEAAWYGEVTGAFGESRERINHMLCGDGSSPNDLAVSGAAMRLVYHVEESERRAGAEAADRIKSAWIAAGARTVKLDPRIETVHRSVRCEAIREAKSTADRVRAYWTSRLQLPARADSILAKLGEIEGAAA